MLSHLDLFSGIGGFALAANWAGFTTVGFVEIDKYCQRVLAKHWPGVPIVGDIRNVENIREIVANATRGRFEQCEMWGKTPNDTGEVDKNTRRRTGNPIQPVTLITGGFPCQPFSLAGKRQGTADNRYLWNEMLTVIDAIKPTWVLAENVGGIAGMEFTDSASDLEGKSIEEVEIELSSVLDRVCSDLEKIGYAVQPIIIPACGVNAPHRRDRVFIMAYAPSNGNTGRSKEVRGSECRSGLPLHSEPDNPGHVANATRGRKEPWPEGWASDKPGETTTTNTQRTGLEGADTEGDRPNYTRRVAKSGQRGWQADWWAVEPELGRMANGIPNRVDRLKCLVNAIVPTVAYQILNIIAKIESNKGV